jgi:hypothetical protein
VQLAARLVPGRDQRAQLTARGIELCISLGQRHPEGLGIDGEEHVAGLDLGMVADVHLVHAAGDLGGNLGNVGLDIGVLGRDVAPAPEPEQQRCQDRHARHATEQKPPLPYVVW